MPAPKLVPQRGEPANRAPAAADDQKPPLPPQSRPPSAPEGGQTIVSEPYATALGDVPIPDDGSWLERKVTLEQTPGEASANAIVRGLRVKYGITHPEPAELEIELVNDSSGRTLSLTGRAESAAGKLTANLALSEFDGLAAAGSWTLRVRDVVPGNTGALNYFGLRALHDVTGPMPQEASLGPTNSPMTLQLPVSRLSTASAAPASPASPSTAPVLGWSDIVTEGFEGTFPSAGWTSVGL